MGCSIATDFVNVFVLFHFISFYCILLNSRNEQRMSSHEYRQPSTATMCLAFSPELTLFDSQQARSSSRFTQPLQKAASPVQDLRLFIVWQLHKTEPNN